jgi:hypothetical protein
MGYRALLLFVIACFVFYTYRKALQARADVKRAEVEDELNKPETYQSWLDLCATENAAQEADMKRGEPEDYAKYIAERDAFVAEAEVRENMAATAAAGADARRSAALKSDPHRLELQKTAGGDGKI